MKQLINLSIDLAKVDKSAIKEFTRKDGSKAKFLELTLSLNGEKDKYDNDGSVSIAQTKEQREAKTDRVYVGNAKILWTDSKQATNNVTTEDSQDLPF